MTDEKDLERLERAARSGDAGAQEELGLALLAGAAPGSDRFERGMRWLETAGESGRPSALTARGHVYTQHPTLEDAPARARQCYERAARSGDPEAVERLADLYLFGYGVARDPGKTFSLYRQLSEYGFPAVLCHTAYLYSEGIGCERDESEAASLILRAAAQGYTLAFVLASLRYQRGLGVPEDPAVAAAWMELAAARGFPSAEPRWQALLESLDEHSRNAARELAERIKANIRGLGQMLRTLSIPEDHPDYQSRFNEMVARNYQQLDRPELALDPEVRGCAIRRRPTQRVASEPEVCSWAPRVFRVPGFASAEECAFLLDAAQPILKSTADVRGAGGVLEVDAFDGDCAIFSSFVSTPVLRNLVARFSRLVHIPDRHFEPMSVLRYSVGHEYSPHVDYFDAARMEQHRRYGDLGGQRLITALIYLIPAESGGETYYPASETVVDGEPGTAVVHYNVTPDGLADEASLHHGFPIKAGEKWLARTAVREYSLYGDYFRTL